MEGLDMAIGWRPAREISGDLFDFFELNEDTMVIAFGDSSGKGAAAALYGSLRERIAAIAGSSQSHGRPG